MSRAGGKWLASSVTEEHIAKLRSAGYLSGDISHRLPDKGQLIPTPRPMRGWYSSPISSADWDSLSIPSSGGSCFIMAWISMIWSRT